MAKAKKEESGDLSLKDIFKDVDKLNPDASFLNDSTLSNVTEWIDTGSYALNTIVSGDPYKGIPVGRVIALAGPHSSCKSLFVKQILGNAQKAGYTAVVWDSENAIDDAGSAGLGLNSSAVKYYPVDTIEKCRNQVGTFLDRLIAAGSKHKIIIAIDSLGNLSSEKELDDVEKDKSATDMGIRAKAIKSMMRVITFKAAKAKVPVVVTNHVYDDPAQLRPGMVKKQSGGSGLGYMGSIIVQLSTTIEKIDGDTEGEVLDNAPTIAISNAVSGINLRALTVKNRMVPQFLEVRLYINFKQGLSRTAGMFEVAQAFGVLTKEGRSWKLGAENLGFKSRWINDKATWDKIMPVLAEVCRKQICYGGATPITTTEVAANVIDASDDPDDVNSET